jgi:hypothetical protein
LDKPFDLGSDGSALWDDLAGNADFQLRPDEYRILAAACRQADVVAALEAAFAADPSYLVRGSQGQPTVNGLITEARLGRAELSRLLKALGVPDDDARAQQRAEETAKRMSELGKLSWKKRSGA